MNAGELGNAIGGSGIFVLLIGAWIGWSLFKSKKEKKKRKFFGVVED